MKNKKNAFRLIVLIILVIATAVLLNKYNFLKGYGPNEIKEYIQGKGAMAPIIYVVALTLLPLLLFPDSVLVIAGGMIFGLWEGVVLTSIGSLLGGIIAFIISRVLGKAVVKKIIKRDIVFFDNKGTKSAFLLILMLRLIPLFPFKIVSYSAGLTDMKLRDFSLATVIGSLPGIIVYSNLGDKTTKLGTTEFYISIGLVVFLFAVSLIIKKVLQQKDKSPGW
ncbi:TVP38/TMEM64 family protein [Proteiniborus sp.]|uniref:TVP38/TMEM64 family protein n=1 Tax=Proteiniborus sp. TaxID=2079015 RepID=UPI0033216C4C